METLRKLTSFGNIKRPEHRTSYLHRISVQIGSSLGPNWVLTGSKLDQNGVELEQQPYQVQNRSTRVEQEQQAKRQRSAAIADSRRLSAALERCQLCISSQRRPRHLTLAIGEASYLMLPQKYALSP